MPKSKRSKQKQTTLSTAFSRQRRKSQRAEAGGSSLAGDTGPIVVIESSGDEGAFDDPYTFINTQSHDLEPQRTPTAGVEQQTTPGVGVEQPRTPEEPGGTEKLKTPRTNKRTPKPRKSPTDAERLQMQEDEELKRALEESRKEKEKEDRRRRYRKRKTQLEESELEEQRMILREIQQEKREEGQAVAAAVVTPDLTQEAPPGPPAAEPTSSTEGVVPEDPLASSPMHTRNQQSDSETDHSQSTPPISFGVASQLKSVSLERIVLSLKTKSRGGRKSSTPKRKKPADRTASSQKSSDSESNTPTQPLAEGKPDEAQVRGDRVNEKASGTDIGEVPGVECERDLPHSDTNAMQTLSTEGAHQQADSDATVGEMTSDDETAPEDNAAAVMETVNKSSAPTSGPDVPNTTARDRQEDNSVVGKQASVETTREEIAELASEKGNPCREISVSVEKLRVTPVQVQEGVPMEAWEPVPPLRTREAVTPRGRSSALKLRKPRKRGAEVSEFQEQIESIQPKTKKTKLGEPEEQVEQATVGSHLPREQEKLQEAHPSEECLYKPDVASNPEDIQSNGQGSVEVNGSLCPKTDGPKLDLLSPAQEKPAIVPPASVPGETKVLGATSPKKSNKLKDQSVKLHATHPKKDDPLKRTVELKLHKLHEKGLSNASPAVGTVAVDGSSTGRGNRSRSIPVVPGLQHRRQPSANVPQSQAKVPKPVGARGRKPVVGDIRKNPPPPLFAPAGVPPAEHTSVILRSFDSYFIQLLATQRKQLCRVAWGKPVVPDRKQPSHTLDWKRAKKQQKRLRSDCNLALSIAKTASRTSAVATVSAPSNTCSTKSPSERDDAGETPPSCRAATSHVGAQATPTQLQDTGSGEDFEIEPQQALTAEPTPPRTTPSRKDRLSLGRRSVRSRETGSQEKVDARSGVTASRGHALQGKSKVLKEGQSAGTTPRKDRIPIANARFKLLRPGRVHEFSDSDDDFDSAAPARDPTPIRHSVELASDRANSSPSRTGDFMEINPSPPPSPPPQYIQTFSESRGSLRHSPFSRQPRLSVGKVTAASDSSGKSVSPRPLKKRTKTADRTGHDLDSSDGTDSLDSIGTRPTAKDDEWIDPKAKRSGATLPSHSRGRPKRTARRKGKARFMEDSDDSESDSCGRGDGRDSSNLISDFLSNAAIPTTRKKSPRKPNTMSTKPPLSPPSPSLSSSPFLPSPSSNLFSGSRGRGQKRDDGRLQRTRHRQNAAKGVIDLTEDTQQSRRSADPPHFSGTSSQNAAEFEEGLGDPCMTCPICQKRFPDSEIESHAARCGEEGHYSDSDQSLPSVDVGRRDVATARPIRQAAAPQRTATLGMETDEEMESVDSREEGGGRREEDEEEWVEGSGDGSVDDSADDEEDHHGEWNAQDMDAIDDSSPSGGTLAAPQLLPCEGGGFIVDTSTVSSSPIRAFTKIADLAPHERDSYRNQFSYSKSGRGRGRPRKSGVSGAGMRGRPPQTNTWGRDDFDELVAGSSGQHSSGRGYNKGRGSRGRGAKRWGRGRGGSWKNRGGQKWRGQKYSRKRK